MLLTARIKLLPSPAQAEMLTNTLRRANTACDFISAEAWRTKIFRQYALHHRAYYAVRQNFGLAAQMAVACLAKVADAYKDKPECQRHFDPLGAIAYDDRVLSWNIDAQTVSIWTIDGRQTIRFAGGQRELALLRSRKGETDLQLRRGKWFLIASCETQEAAPIAVEGALGVDLGVTNIAADSDGTLYSGSMVNSIRHRRRRVRTRLQRKGTKSARRRSKALSGKERRFASDVNHTISKRIVLLAARTKRAIALEDLTHIRSTFRASRPQRAVLFTWSFRQLRAFIGYKAKRLGVPVELVEANNTSRTCPQCGHIDKANRRTQFSFCCVRCAYAGHADTIAAVNIGRRAAVSRPYVSDTAQR